MRWLAPPEQFVVRDGKVYGIEPDAPISGEDKFSGSGTNGASNGGSSGEAGEEGGSGGEEGEGQGHEAPEA